MFIILSIFIPLSVLVDISCVHFFSPVNSFFWCWLLFQTFCLICTRNMLNGIKYSENVYKYKRHLKNTERYNSQNILSITIKMRTLVPVNQSNNSSHLKNSQKCKWIQKLFPIHRIRKFLFFKLRSFESNLVLTFCKETSHELELPRKQTKTIKWMMHQRKAETIRIAVWLNSRNNPKTL